MGETRFPATERERDWQSSGKRLRSESEFDRSLSDLYVNRREDHRLADRGVDGLNVRLLRDHAHAPTPNYIHDRRFVQQNGPVPSSSGLTVSERLNLRSDSDRLDPFTERRWPDNDHQFLPADASKTLFL